MLSGKDTNRIHSALLQWYRQNRRPYPWRNSDTTPYQIMVSEIMLQQTQAGRVAEMLPRFIECFPTLHSLADASVSDVIKAWKGLGYNNRAIRLREAAKMIVDNFKGRIPVNEHELLSLPGFGRYTAAAVATFVHGVRTIVIDVNIQRVYSRLLRADDVANTNISTEVMALARSFIKRIDPSEWYQAVMDLGNSVCRARQPNCVACPLQQYCASAHTIGSTTSTSKQVRRVEPSFNGRPNRIWRGAVVNLLRSGNRGFTKHQILATLELKSTDVNTKEWFDKIVSGLTRDGIIKCEKGRIHLAD